PAGGGSPAGAPQERRRGGVVFLVAAPQPRLCYRHRMSMNVEAEIRDLKRRVGELEGSFGFLTQQVQNVHKDLLAFEEKTEQRFNIVDQRFDRLESKVDALDRKIDTKVDGLAKSLPGIIRDALSDYEIKSKKK
ncbi:MAG: hypothetical protein WBV65_20785, partial [Xanthobacteraceae bacterium]